MSVVTLTASYWQRRGLCRDLGHRAEFASLTAREYEDEMAMVQKALAYRT
jgi:hypothetical protein